MKKYLIAFALFSLILTTLFCLLLGAAWTAPFFGISCHGYGFCAGVWGVTTLVVSAAATEVK